MLHPVGSLPPSVYWRRRIALLASVVVLIALSVYVLRPGCVDNPSAAARTTQSTTPASTPTAPIASTPASTTAPAGSPTG